MRYAISLLASAVMAGGLLFTQAFGHPPPPPPTQTSVAGCSFSPDGKFVLVMYSTCGSVGSNHSLLYDMTSGREIRRLDPLGCWFGSSFSSPAPFLPDSQRMLWPGEVSGYSQEQTQGLAVKDVTRTESVRALESPPKGTSMVTCIAASGDGKFALAGYDNGTLRLWNVETGKFLRTFDTGALADNSRARVAAITFSPDGKKALSGGGSLTLWDVDTGKVIRSSANDASTIRIPIVWGSRFAFCPSGKYAVTDSYCESRVRGTGKECALSLWEIDTGKEVRTFESDMSCLAFTADGKYLLCTRSDDRGYNWLVMYEVETGHSAWSWNLGPDRSTDHRFVGLSPHGRLLLSSSGEEVHGMGEQSDTLLIKVWDVWKKSEIRTLRQPAKSSTPQAWQFWNR